MKAPKKLRYTWTCALAAVYWFLLYIAFDQWWCLTLAATCVGAIVVKRTALWYYDRPQWLCHVVHRKLLDDIKFAGFRPPANEALLRDRGLVGEFFQEGADVVSFVANLRDARRVANCKRFAELAEDFCCIWIYVRPSKFGLSTMSAHSWGYNWLGAVETVKFGNVVEFCVPRAEVNRQVDLGYFQVTELYGRVPEGAQNKREAAVCRFANAVPDYFTFR